MTLLLSVLKVIGIVLLVILAVVLALILIVLFVPLRYKLKGDIKADDNHYDVRADVTWLLHLVHAAAWFLRTVMEDEVDENDPRLEKEGFHYELKVLCFRILSSDSTPDTDSRDSIEPDKEPEAEPGAESGAGPDAEQDTESNAEPEAGSDKEPNVETGTEPGTEPEEDTDGIPEKFSDKLKDYAGLIKDLFSKAKGTKENAGYKFRDIYDRISEAKEKAEHYYGIVSKERSKEAIAFALNELLRILRALRPRKYSMDMTYGFGDPALTGEVTGVFAALFMSAGKRISLRPDFDRTVIEGEFYFKGRIRVLTLAIVLWRLYFNKNFRRFIKEIRN